MAGLTGERAGFRGGFRWGALLWALGLLALGCGSGSTSSEATRVAPPADPPAITAGATDGGQVTIDGTAVDYITTTPAGFETGDTAPVLLTFPPGSQDLALTRSIVDRTYATEALARGWVVVSPAAPGGELFFDGSEDLIPGFMDWIETWVNPEGEGFHIAGISNGGISSFRVATRSPKRVRSVTVFPGFPRSVEDKDALGGLAGVPVRMYVGAEDTSWVGPMSEAATDLRSAGGDVLFEEFAGEGHIISALADGRRVFEELDTFRDN